MLIRKNSVVVIRETHKGLLYEDGMLVDVLPSGRYEIPRHGRFARRFRPAVDIVLVDMREREQLVTIHEPLTADCVPVTVVLLARYRVVDPRSALHEVRNFEDRIQSDIHLAASRAVRVHDFEGLLAPDGRFAGTIVEAVRSELAGYGIGLKSLQTRTVRVPDGLRSMLLRLAASTPAEDDMARPLVPFTAQLG